MSKKKVWRCFFCDEVLTNRQDASEHFGEQGCTSDVPACVDPLRTDEKARNRELREAQKLATRGFRHEERADDLEYRLRQVDGEIRKYFGDDCTSLWQAGDRYNDVKFELKMAREEIDAIKGGQK